MKLKASMSGSSNQVNPLTFTFFVYDQEHLLKQTSFLHAPLQSFSQLHFSWSNTDKVCVSPNTLTSLSYIISLLKCVCSHLTSHPLPHWKLFYQWRSVLLTLLIINSHQFIPSDNLNFECSKEMDSIFHYQLL